MRMRTCVCACTDLGLLPEVSTSGLFLGRMRVKPHHTPRRRPKAPLRLKISPGSLAQPRPCELFHFLACKTRKNPVRDFQRKFKHFIKRKIFLFFEIFRVFSSIFFFVYVSHMLFDISRYDRRYKFSLSFSHTREFEFSFFFSFFSKRAYVNFFFFSIRFDTISFRSRVKLNYVNISNNNNNNKIFINPS